MEPIYAGIAGSLIAWMDAMSWRIEISGIERIPVQGGAVVATNHVGYLDWLFVGLAGRRRGRNIRFVAKRELWERPFTRAIMSGAKHIPADRFGSPGVAVRRAVDALRAGEIVGMFPEGTIDRSFLPLVGKTGAARMAMEAGVPLIPGAVWGSQRLVTKGRPRDLRRGVAIDVRFGPPVPCAGGDDPAEVTGHLMRAIRGLVEEAIATYPQSPRSPDDRWWLPAAYGGTAPTEEEAARIRATEAESKRRPSGNPRTDA